MDTDYRKTHPAMSFAEQNCTDIIATNGGILKFCQDARTLDVFESGVDSRAIAPPVRLIDDPNVLSALQSKLSLRPEFAASRRLVAKSCAVGDKHYLAVSVESLKRILQGSAERIVLRDDAPFMTGSIVPTEPPMLDPR